MKRIQPTIDVQRDFAPLEDLPPPPSPEERARSIRTIRKMEKAGLLHQVSLHDTLEPTIYQPEFWKESSDPQVKIRQAEARVWIGGTFWPNHCTVEMGEDCTLPPPDFDLDSELEKFQEGATVMTLAEFAG